MNNNVKKCLEHRYRYYVLNEPIISDYEYDILEKEAKKNDINGILNTPGSSLKSSYPEEIIRICENRN